MHFHIARAPVNFDTQKAQELIRPAFTLRECAVLDDAPRGCFVDTHNKLMQNRTGDSNAKRRE